MSSINSDSSNRILDEIIESRHSTRKFKPDPPPRELIEQIIEAGRLAPYAGLAVTRHDFRKFTVIPGKSKSKTLAETLLKHRVCVLYEELHKKSQQDASMKEMGKAYLETLRVISQPGIPIIGEVPYYIVVAEQKGIPPVEHQSLAHCMENMWLKATALGLGFRLFTVTAEMAGDPEFCGLVQIPFGEFALDGCLVGYADAAPYPQKRGRLDEGTKWIE